MAAYILDAAKHIRSLFLHPARRSSVSSVTTCLASGNPRCRYWDTLARDFSILSHARFVVPLTIATLVLLH